MSRFPLTSLRFRRTSVPALALALGTGLAFGACSSEQPTSASDDVADVKHTEVKNQAIGNCWLYATVGWAESLHLTHSGEELDLSESYLSYWHWFEQITEGAAGEPAIERLDPAPDELNTGGSFGVAAELMLRYGVISEGQFIPEEAEAARSSRQSAAESAIKASLKSGALKAPEARRDPALVRAELDKAWQLKPAVVALLDEVFGQDVARTLLDDSVDLPEGSGLQRASQITVGENAATGEALHLDDAVGRASSPDKVHVRTGPFAWTSVSYPAASSTKARRDFLRRAQKALHVGQPVIISWLVDFNANKNNVFVGPPATPGRQGGHMTLLEDYEIDNVPGYGTLKAGELVTDEKALEAALADEATIKFFRIKNSWGSSLAPQEAGDELRGYYDLTMTYLDGPMDECKAEGTNACATKKPTVPLRYIVLPPETFGTAGAGTNGTCHSTCEAGAALQTTCDPCAAAVCAADEFCCDPKNGKWDEQCVRQVADHRDAPCQ